MEQLVRVMDTNEDGTAQVLPISLGVCLGDCCGCSGCGAVRQKLTACNPIGAEPGEVVTIKAKSGKLFAVAAVYLMPVILFFAGYGFGHLLWGNESVVALVAFGIGVILATLCDRLVMAKQKMVYTITGYAQFVLQSRENEDCNLD